MARDPTLSTLRERVLLLIATAFVLIGAVTLTLADTGFTLLHLSCAVGSFAISFAAAHLFLSRYLPHRDPLLLPTAALLTGWGLLLIGRLAPNFLLRQVIWLPIAAGALLAITRLGGDLRWLRRFRYTWLTAGLALLAATLVLGVNPSGYGPRLWLGGFGVYFQPAEVLKLLLTVYLASYLAERKELIVNEGHRIGRWRLPPLAYVGPLLAMFGLAVVLLTWQQDLGAAMLFFFTFLAMLYLATGRWGYAAAGMALFIAAGTAGYYLSDKVMLRVDTWLNPWPEAADRAFQIVQSLLAFGAGGLFGRGLGLGNPTYIPAVHTDFVFAAVGEEFGLAGLLVIVALYGVLMIRGFRVAAGARQPFERFLAAGSAAGLAIQAWVIMAGNARLAPIAGVTLPFVSYGGSSLLISFVTLALLLRISSVDRKATAMSGRSPLKDEEAGAHGVTSPLSRPGVFSAGLKIKSLFRANHTARFVPDAAHWEADKLVNLTRVLTLALALLAATCGYWTVASAEALRTREDNPRRVLYEQRIVRGRILDRYGAVLTDVEIGEDGIAARRYLVPEAAPAVGYASLRHGTGGIEAAFDTELRGEAGRSSWQAAWDDLLHRPPQGQDVQMTLDTALQVQAQQALTGRAGAIVLLDAESGDILALASSPTFDPARLEETWDALREDPAAPLVNRATQGLYQPGAALQTIVIAEALIDLAAPLPAADAPVAVNGSQVGCAAPLATPPTLAAAYAAGCPAPFVDVGEMIGIDGLGRAIKRWGLTTTPPPLEIPTEAADWVAEEIMDTAAMRLEAIGQGTLTVSPLQMALVAGALASDGQMPAPRLVLRVQDPEGNWWRHTAIGEPRVILSPARADELLAAWPHYEERVVGHLGLAVAGEAQRPHAWFLGIAPADASRYVVVVLLEHPDDPQQAAAIGSTLLGETLESLR